MSDLKIEFETALTNKLCLKSTDSISEEEILFKLFKQFDINNKETCNENEFIQTMKQIGISGFKENDLKNLFKLYKKEEDNELNYIEFINTLYGQFNLEQTFNTKNNNNINKNEIMNNIEKNNLEINEMTIQKEKLIQNNLSKKEYLEDSSIKEIINKIRKKILKRGIRGISSIIENFREIDINNSQSIDFEEFKKASNEFKFDLNENELEKAFFAFDLNNNGIIEYDEFIRVIRGEMNNFRKKIVFNAFKSIDTNNIGAVNIEDIKKKYNCKNHPEVKIRKRSEQQILNEFIHNFEITYNYLNGSDADGIVMFDDFLEYYQNVSMSIDNDDYFEFLVNSEWKDNSNNNNYIYNNYNNYIDQSPINKYHNDSSLLKTADQTPIRNISINNNNNNNNYNNYNTPPIYNKSNYHNIENYHINQINFPHQRNFSNLNNKNPSNCFKKFRDIIASRGPRGIMSLRRSFMLSDEDNSNLIDYDEFLKYCFEYKIPLSEEEEISIFSQFDNNNDGHINYIEFLNVLIGKMNIFRFQIVTQVFNYLDYNNNGFITINDMRNYYNVNNHPDVINGRRSSSEVEAEFLDNINYHFILLRTNKLKNGHITLQDFTEYYDIISMSIHSDILFQNILFGVWNLKFNNISNFERNCTKKNNGC